MQNTNTQSKFAKVTIFALCEALRGRPEHPFAASRRPILNPVYLLPLPTITLPANVHGMGAGSMIGSSGGEARTLWGPERGTCEAAEAEVHKGESVYEAPGKAWEKMRRFCAGAHGANAGAAPAETLVGLRGGPRGQDICLRPRFRFRPLMSRL